MREIQIKEIKIKKEFLELFKSRKNSLRASNMKKLLGPKS